MNLVGILFLIYVDYNVQDVDGLSCEGFIKLYILLWLPKNTYSKYCTNRPFYSSRYDMLCKECICFVV